MKTKLFIPKTLKIGFQNRNDTHTGKLAYVIYYDETGKLRKETSWKSWCDNKIPSIEIPNVPTAGYVLNKGVRRYSDWGSGRSVIRIHDPREFEFEISVDNLIGILSHSDVSSGDIGEKCVFAWYGTELVLLPCNSVAYTESVAWTDKQAVKIGTKDLVKGMIYSRKKDRDNPETYVYLGFFPFYEKTGKFVLSDGRVFSSPHDYKMSGSRTTFARGNKAADIREYALKGNKHVFRCINSVRSYLQKDGAFEIITPSTLLSTDEMVDNYAEHVEAFQSSSNGSALTDIEIVPMMDYWKTIENDKSGYRSISPFSIVNQSLYRMDTSIRLDAQDSYIYDFLKTEREYDRGFGSNHVGKIGKSASGDLQLSHEYEYGTTNHYYYSDRWFCVAKDHIAQDFKVSLVRTQVKNEFDTLFALSSDRDYRGRIQYKLANKERLSEILFEHGFGALKKTYSNGKTEISTEI